MLKVGLTGNIGSGKTIIAEIFKILGTPVFSADIEAKKILNSESVKEKLVDYFGRSVIEDKRVNRQKLASIVFSDKTALEKINSLIHPEVRQKFLNWTMSFKNKDYVLFEAAIIFESGYDKQLDFIINVAADREIRINRVMSRDKVTREMVLMRMKNQWEESRKNMLADFVIRNENYEPVISQVLSAHRKISNILKRK